MELVNKEMQYIPINAAASYQGETELIELVNKEMQYIPINAAVSYQRETGLIYITFIFISLRINDMGAF